MLSLPELKAMKIDLEIHKRNVYRLREWVAYRNAHRAVLVCELMIRKIERRILEESSNE